MLITPERVFYAGLLGRPRERCSGAFNIYVSIEGGLRLDLTADGHEKLRRNGRRAAEYQAHHRQRLSFGAQHRDRAGERASGRSRRPRKASLGA